MSYCQGCADKDAELASLRASHQEVTRIVREWQEAWTERRADPIDTRETHDRLRDAEAVLASFPVEEAP